MAVSGWRLGQATAGQWAWGGNKRGLEGRRARGQGWTCCLSHRALRARVGTSVSLVRRRHGVWLHYAQRDGAWPRCRLPPLTLIASPPPSGPPALSSSSPRLLPSSPRVLESSSPRLSASLSCPPANSSTGQLPHGFSALAWWCLTPLPAVSLPRALSSSSPRLLPSSPRVLESSGPRYLDLCPPALESSPLCLSRALEPSSPPPTPPILPSASVPLLLRIPWGHRVTTQRPRSLPSSIFGSGCSVAWPPVDLG